MWHTNTNHIRQKVKKWLNERLLSVSQFCMIDCQGMMNSKAKVTVFPIKNNILKNMPMNCFGNIKHYTDDGFTDRNFKRSRFQEMLTDIEMGKVGVVQKSI